MNAVLRRMAMALFPLCLSQAVHAQSTMSHDDAVNAYRASVAYADMSVTDRRTLAYMLICSGDYGSTVPRIMTPALFQAVKSFQRRDGEPVTGVPTKRTLEELVTVGGLVIGRFGMAYVDHPTAGVSAWIPSRLALKRTSAANGYRWVGSPDMPEIDFGLYSPDWSLARLREAIIASDPRASVLEDTFGAEGFTLATRNSAGVSVVFFFRRTVDGDVGFRIAWKEQAMPEGIRLAKLMAAGFSEAPYDGDGPR